MPSGRYSFYDTHDSTPLGEERFSCAPGPSGWRYTAQTFSADGEPDGSVDLTLDALSRPLRLELRSGLWQIRAGLLDGLSWVRSHQDDAEGQHAREGNDRAHAFAGRSPAFLVATARLLRLSPGGSSRLRVVTFTDPVLAPRTHDQGWTLDGTESHPTDNGPLVVERYRVADLATGEEGLVHLAGDVVLAAPGIELEQLETPPSRTVDPGEYAE
ncbi:hypothetical protein ACEZDB_37580 [Streptacidiphilus sp. N1-3]|uniref:Glycolipid-binding domain-containing protein n=1 Tax=Streptacidiphilus alkalitolerans TaxID=3342712 RepID=A0ABV6XDN2_9ACTN